MHNIVYKYIHTYIKKILKRIMKIHGLYKYDIHLVGMHL